MGNPNWVLLAWAVSSEFPPPNVLHWQLYKTQKQLLLRRVPSLSSTACRRSSATQAVSSLTPAQPQKPSRGLHKHNWLNFPERHGNTGILIPQELLQPC